jgi:hypothetical protein
VGQAAEKADQRLFAALVRLLAAVPRT